MNSKNIVNRIKYQYNTNKKDFIKVVIKTINPLLILKRYSDKRMYDSIIKNKKEIIKNILGNYMILPVEDKGLSKDLILYSIREPLFTKLFLKEVTKDMNIVDLGANIGYYLLMEAKITSKGKGRVWGIEPNPKSFAILAKNVKLNNYKNVVLLNKCIGDKDDKTDFFISNQWNVSRVESGAPRKDEDLQKIQIAMNKLDTLFSNVKVDLIRMDVEGYEKKIFKGMEKVVKNNPNIKIFFEYHPILLTEKEKYDIKEFIKNNNFKIKYFINERRKEIIENCDVNKLDKENFTYGVQLILIKK